MSERPNQLYETNKKPIHEYAHIAQKARENGQGLKHAHADGSIQELAKKNGKVLYDR